MIKRNLFSTVYKDQKTALINKKKSLIGTKDLKKWEVDQDKCPVSKVELINDEKLAMRYMFSNVRHTVYSGNH